MEKIPHSYSEKLKPVVLYLDDIQIIVDVFKEASENIEIVSSNYKFNDVDELKELKREYINELTIHVNSPHISFDIRNSDGMLYSSSGGVTERGVIQTIKTYIKLSNKHFSFFYSLIYPLIIFYTGVILFIIYDTGYYFNISIILMVLGSILYLTNYYNNFYRKSYVYLCDRIDKPNFFKRKKDEVILASLSALFLLFIYLLVDWLTT